MKAVEVALVAGVFRDPQGNAIDLRPKEGRPCFANAKELSELELLRLIVKAITNQLEKLKESPFDETATRIGLLNVRRHLPLASQGTREGARVSLISGKRREVVLCSGAGRSQDRAGVGRAQALGDH